MEYITVYKKTDNGSIVDKLIDVNDVSHYMGMGWSIEKPKTEVEKPISKKEKKKDIKKDV
jgi:hypothetical protein